MRILIIIIVFGNLFLSESLKINVTIILSICWFLYTLYFACNLRGIKDKKIVTKKCSDTPPNDNKSYNVRYLYSAKGDFKVFFTTIMELLIEGSISFVKSNNTYYFIDNKLKEENLTKSETYVKKILFIEIGSDNKVSIERIKKICRSNSGYIYSIYKEWQNIFLYESAGLKYFKSVKPLVDNSLFYFMISMIIAIYNIFFTNYFVVALIIFTITTILIKSVNDYSNREIDATSEYTKWLEFKNYICSNNNMDLLDNKVLERYALYSYVLDEYETFSKILNNKYSKDIKCFDNSILLYIMNLKIFDIVEKDIKESINTAYIKSIVLFARNKGKV